MKFDRQDIILPTGLAYWLLPRAQGAVSWTQMSERQYFEICLTDLLEDDKLASEYMFLIASDVNDPAYRFQFRGSQPHDETRHFNPVDDIEPVGLVPGRKPVLLYLSRESGIPVSLKTSARFHTVFQGFLATPRVSARIFPLQLGAFNERWHCERPMEHTRDCDIFFAGKLTRVRARSLMSVSDPKSWRTIFYDLISRTPRSNRLLKNLAAVVSAPPLATGLRGRMIFTSRWAGGMTTAQYRAQLLNTRVVLCPRGAISVETFRHFEAASAGCAIVTERLPDTYADRDNPFIEVDNIDGWLPALRALMSGGDDALIAKGKASRKFWEGKLSPSATANYIRGQLNSRTAL